jgi:hypothetical protein
MFTVDEPSGLLTINCFLELTVEEGISDIQLMHEPLVRRGECEDRTNPCGLNHGGERLVEVDTWALNIPT